MPTLPQNIIFLSCSFNNLTSLPTIPYKLKELYCSDNHLTSMPTLPQNIIFLSCSFNNLNYFPTLPENIHELFWHNNPIYEILGHQKSKSEIKQNLQTLNNFRHLWYCLIFKKHFRKWLWVKIREPKIEKMYDPIYLIKNLKEEDDLDVVLNNWK
jgi:Leucine-rich repeat (LRR) protein